jgi:hypothetical protein
MPTPITLPIAPYAPDQPGAPAAQAAKNVRGVFPRTSTSYGAMPQPSVVSNALSNQCQGMMSFLGAGGVSHAFAGDLSKLYHIGGAGTAFTWNDVSLAGGYNVSSGTLWEFVHFNGQILATDYNDPIQAFTLGGGAGFFTLAAAAPKAKHIAVIKNSFVMVGNTQDPANATKEQRVWWCAAGDASNWPIPGSQNAATFQSGARDLLGDGGVITALRSDLTGADGLVFQTKDMKRIIYVGPPAIFDLLPAQNGRGTFSPYSPVVVGGTCYFLGYDGFYSTDGAAVSPIGSDKINRTFLDDLTDFTTVHGAKDPVRQIIWWSYAGQGSINGVHNRIIGYSWLFDRWCILDVTAEAIGNVYSFGYTLDQLYTVLGYTLDTLPAPLDSNLWTAGTEVLAMFDSSHQLNFFTGSAMAALVDTQEMELVPGQRSLITGVRPLVDGTNLQTPTVAIQHRELGETAPAVTPYAAINSLGKAPVRASGRYVRATISIPAGGDWTNISGAAVDAVPQGQR